MAVHKVVRGDTLNAIAAANGVTLQQLLDANPGIEPRNLQIGSEVNLPSSSGSEDPEDAITVDTVDDLIGEEPGDTSPSSTRVRRLEQQVTVGFGGSGDDPATQLTILTGEEMKWFFDKNTGKWYVQYGLPNSKRAILYEASPDQMDALFGRNKRPSQYRVRSFSTLTGRENVTFGGNIGEMEGTGSLESEVERVMALALDSGTLPEWALIDGKAMDIIYTGQAENKSMEWMITEISKTAGFQRRFRGLEKFRSDSNMTIIEGITAYLEYEAGIKAAVKAYGRNPARVTPGVVGGLLNAGYSLETQPCPHLAGLGTCAYPPGSVRLPPRSRSGRGV
jgi:hypothetical protein